MNERRNPQDRAVADRGVYATKVNPCGCRSVPEGQHVGGSCVDAAPIKEAEECPNCSLRGAWVLGVCPFCGYATDPESL